MERKLLLAACAVALAAPVMANDSLMGYVSGTDKKTGSPETGLRLQKNFLDGQLVLPGNAAVGAAA